VVVTDSNPPAANAQHFSVTNSFTVVVNEINTPPQLTVPATQTIDELTPLQVTVSATDTDVPANPLTFSLISPPTGMAINPATGAIAWTPTEAQGPSTNTVTVVVTDSNPASTSGQQSSATNTFTVVVREVNSVPTLDPISDVTVHFGAPFTVQAVAKDSDLPANVLTYTLEQAPAGLSIGANNGTISWTPAENQVGLHALTVRVTDNGSPPLSATASFQVTVAGQGSHLEVALLPSGASRLVQITAIGDAGNNYVLQKSKDLVTWDTLVQFTMTAAPHQYIDPDSSNTVGFYRLKLAQ